jgi:hypothetical protein
LEFDPSLIQDRIVSVGRVEDRVDPRDWMPKPCSSLWQLLHVRPLIPRFRKNGFLPDVSMFPAVEKVGRAEAVGERRLVVDALVHFTDVLGY